MQDLQNATDWWNKITTKVRNTQDYLFQNDTMAVKFLANIGGVLYLGGYGVPEWRQGPHFTQQCHESVSVIHPQFTVLRVKLHQLSIQLQTVKCQTPQHWQHSLPVRQNIFSQKSNFALQSISAFNSNKTASFLLSLNLWPLGGNGTQTPSPWKTGFILRDYLRDWLGSSILSWISRDHSSKVSCTQVSISSWSSTASRLKFLNPDKSPSNDSAVLMFCFNCKHQIAIQTLNDLPFIVTDKTGTRSFERDHTTENSEEIWQQNLSPFILHCEEFAQHFCWPLCEFLSPIRTQTGVDRASCYCQSVISALTLLSWARTHEIWLTDSGMFFCFGISWRPDVFPRNSSLVCFTYTLSWPSKDSLKFKQNLDDDNCTWCENFFDKVREKSHTRTAFHSYLSVISSLLRLGLFTSSLYLWNSLNICFGKRKQKTRVKMNAANSFSEQCNSGLDSIHTGM